MNASQRKAFELYLKMGQRRSILRLLDRLAEDGSAPSDRTLYDWSSKFGWQALVQEFDRKQQAADFERIEQEHTAMNERHLRGLTALQNLGLQVLAAMPQEKIPASLALRMYLDSIKAERKIRTDPNSLRIDATVDIREWAIERDIDPEWALAEADSIVAGYAGEEGHRPRGR